jgi:hypothetical protein
MKECQNPGEPPLRTCQMNHTPAVAGVWFIQPLVGHVVICHGHVGCAFAVFFVVLLAGMLPAVQALAGQALVVWWVFTWCLGLGHDMKS